MNKHNQTAVFYHEKWDMPFGRSSHFFEQGFHKYVAKNFDHGFITEPTQPILSPFAPIKAEQNRWKALLLSITSRRKMKSIQAKSIADKAYPKHDIQNVVQRMTQDLKQMMDHEDMRSMYNLTEAQIAQCSHDIQILAEGGYLHFVDICLLNPDSQNGKRIEQKAYRYEMNTASQKIRTNRPNSVFISSDDKSQPALRIVLKYTAHYTREAQIDLEPQLFAAWKATYCDITHSPLRADIDREYSCQGYGIQRKIFC